MENGAPADFPGGTATPPTLMCLGAGGDGERSHGLKQNYYVHVLYIIAGMMAASRSWPSPGSFSGRLNRYPITGATPPFPVPPIAFTSSGIPVPLS